MGDKVIVSNRSALNAKYGNAGLARITTAVRKLVAADKRRGLTTRVVFLDELKAMTRLGAPHVETATNQQQNKAAIDAVCAAFTPDYLMILGSVDVIPHQDLANPVFDPKRPKEDPDRVVPSDLPYACEAPASTRIEDFIAPTRVVGRLPDVTGDPDPAYLLKVLSHATNPVQSPAASITAFGLTAKVWQRSTSKSLRAMFGPGTRSRTSPKAGPEWPPEDLDHRVHFINCHGDKRSPQFFGQPRNFPVAHDAAWITTRVQAGTIATAECCYGAELYNPRGATGQMGIGNTYLACGSVGYFGSTTIAYGPATTNNYADVICRLFIQEVLKGRSTGDAALTARLMYAKLSKPINAVDLKTLAQFILLGDPSIHPVRKPKTKSVARAMATRPKALDQRFDSSATARGQRRRESRADAAVLESTAPVASEAEETSTEMLGVLARHAADAGIVAPSIQTFGTRIGTPTAAVTSSAIPRATAGRPVAATRRAAQTDVRVHVAVGRSAEDDGRRLDHPVAIVAEERGGRVIRLETIYGKAGPARPDGESRETPGGRQVEERASRRRSRK